MLPKSFSRAAFIIAAAVGLIQVLGVAICFAVPYTKPASQREKVIVNQDWKYSTGDISGAEATGFNDANWTAVNIPHSFNIPYWQTGVMGTPAWGWYRKHYTVPASWSGRKIFVEFEAAFQHAWVYVNGNLVGEHKGGYTAFSFDITSRAVVGANNVIAVRLSAAWDKDITPLAGEHEFSGGIYRDVSITSTAPAHVTFYGTYVSTPWTTPVRSDAGYTGPTTFPTAPVAVKTEVKTTLQPQRATRCEALSWIRATKSLIRRCGTHIPSQQEQPIPFSKRPR